MLTLVTRESSYRLPSFDRRRITCCRFAPWSVLWTWRKGKKNRASINYYFVWRLILFVIILFVVGYAYRLTRLHACVLTSTKFPSHSHSYSHSHSHSINISLSGMSYRMWKWLLWAPPATRTILLCCKPFNIPSLRYTWNSTYVSSPTRRTPYCSNICNAVT